MVWVFSVPFLPLFLSNTKRQREISLLRSLNSVFLGVVCHFATQWNLLLQLNRTGRTRANLRMKLRRERGTATTLAMFCGVFFLTWLPHVIGVLVFKVCFPCDLSPVDLDRTGAFVKCMQYSNGAFNPFLFAFRDAEINKTDYYVAGEWLLEFRPTVRNLSVKY